MNRFKKILYVSLIMILLSSSLVFAYNQRGDINSFFKEIDIPESTIVDGNVVSFFGNISVQGKVQGDVVAFFGKIHVEGAVSGDTVSIFGGITVEETGIVDGDAVAVLGYGLDNMGTIRQEEINILGFFSKNVSIARMIFSLIFFLILSKQFFALVISLVTVMLFNERFDRMATGAQQEVGKKLLVGLLVYFGSFIGFAILVMTVIGVPLAFLLIPAILILSFLGNTTIKVAIGRKISTYFNKRWSIFMELVAGTAVFVFLEATVVGNLVTFVLKFIGIGELFDSRFGEEIKKDLI